MFLEVIGNIFFKLLKTMFTSMIFPRLHFKSWSGKDLMSLYVPASLEEEKQKSKSILKEICFHCQSFCDHNTFFLSRKNMQKMW